MATVFFEKATLNFNSTSLGYYSYGVYVSNLFEAGKKYTIEFDGDFFTGEAVEMLDGITTCVFVGNLGIVGLGDDTGEPFVVRTIESSKWLSVQTTSTGTTHALAIYEGVLQTNLSVSYSGGEVLVGTDVDLMTDISVFVEYSDGTKEEITDYVLSGSIAEGENTITVTYEELTATFIVVGAYKKLILKDHFGNDVVYERIKNIKIPTLDGSGQSFTFGEAIEKEVVLAMAEGDQILEAKEGELFGKVTVKKPDTLLPEYIAEGVDIGGVIGALAAGGSIKVAAGNIKPSTGGAVTIKHDLGAIPDAIVLFAATGANSGIKICAGIKKTFAEKFGLTNYQFVSYGSSFSYNSVYGIGDGKMLFSNENETEITVGNESYFFYSKSTYNWIAISGC